MEFEENKMGTEKILPLLLKMSVPPTVSMLTSSLYNIVDSVFVARLGNEAFAAVSLAFPIQILIVALAIGSGVGVNSYVARKLGEKSFHEADSAAAHGIILSIIHFAFLAFLGFLFIKPFFKMFTENENIFAMGTAYSYIVTFFSFGIITQIGIEKTLQGTGNTLAPMFLQIIGAVTNIILDPIMIYGYFGFSPMGVTGAAVATVCGQITALLCSLYVLFFHKQAVKITLKDFKWNGKIVKEIYNVGIPSFFIISVSSFMVSGINFILAGISDAAVSVFGIYYKLQTFVYMPTSGITQGAMPIMGYNYGAGNRKRLFEALKYSLMICAGINFIGTLIFGIFPEKILSFFKVSQEALTMGTLCLKIISTSFVLGSICFIFCCFLQSVGRGISSLVITLFRQLLFLIPLAFLFGKLWGLSGVWTSFFAAEAFSCCISLLIFKNFLKNDNIIRK